MDLSDRRGLDTLIRNRKLCRIQNEKMAETTFNFGEVKIMPVAFDQEQSPKEQQSMVIRNNLQVR